MLFSLKEQFSLMSVLFKIRFSQNSKLVNINNDLLSLWNRYAYLEQSGYALGKSEGCALIKNSEYKILIRPRTSDLEVFFQILIEMEYKKLINMILDKKKKEDIKIILDAGSNIGLASIFFKMQFKNSKIISVEPDRDNFKMMQKNFKLNTLDNAYSYQSALWSKNADVSLSNDFRDGKEWSFHVKEKEAQTEKTVQGVTLEKLLLEYDMVDLIKIDIEGAEWEILNDYGTQVVLKNKVKFFAIEIHEEFGKPADLIAILSSLGFECSESGEYTIGYNTHLIN